MKYGQYQNAEICFFVQDDMFAAFMSAYIIRDGFRLTSHTWIFRKQG